MSDIDFQNGLVVGMTLAGKNGLVGEAGEIDNSPHIISAENIDFYTTEIVFDRALKTFSVVSNLSAFMILAQTSWVTALYLVSAIEVVNITTLRLSHSSIADADGVALVGYNKDSGTIQSTGSVALNSFIFAYNIDFGTALKIRKRIYIDEDTYPIFDAEDITFTISAVAKEPDPNEGEEEDIDYIDVNADDNVETEYTISIL